ncbi:hypothetical protein [Nocardioides litoris]|uniref:hypothetical protein n=1 Tax=Nocardioides litoris TaxID=1926648 RepID=UPI00111D64A8|nr:hypothetical protein [Nocardioides litoris]
MADHRHKRDTNARRLLGALPTRLKATTLAAPLAVVATAGIVSFGVLGADVTPADVAGAAPVVGDSLGPAAEAASVAERTPTLSRGTAARSDAVQGREAAAPVVPAEPATPTKPTKAELLMRAPAVKAAIKDAETELWTTEALNLWANPSEDARQLGEIAPGEQVTVTGRSLNGREEIVWKGEDVRWVTAGYLSEEEPFTLGGDCTNGTTVPAGVSENIKKVHAAVCAEFPEITTYGTFRGDGEHAQGIAVDIMVSGDRGWEVAEFVRKYYADLGVSYVIYSQNIWSVQRSGEGWRGMEDRGSTTANHYDHVHVTTY